MRECDVVYNLEGYVAMYLVLMSYIWSMKLMDMLLFPKRVVFLALLI